MKKRGDITQFIRSAETQITPKCQDSVALVDQGVLEALRTACQAAQAVWSNPRNGNMHFVCLHGASGSGRTSCAKKLASLYTRRVVYVNASDDEWHITITRISKDACVIVDDADYCRALSELKSLLKKTNVRLFVILVCHTVNISVIHENFRTIRDMVSCKATRDMGAWTDAYPDIPREHVAKSVRSGRDDIRKICVSITGFRAGDLHALCGRMDQHEEVQNTYMALVATNTNLFDDCRDDAMSIAYTTHENMCRDIPNISVVSRITDILCDMDTACRHVFQRQEWQMWTNITMTPTLLRHEYMAHARSHGPLQPPKPSVVTSKVSYISNRICRFRTAEYILGAHGREALLDTMYTYIRYCSMRHEQGVSAAVVHKPRHDDNKKLLDFINLSATLAKDAALKKWLQRVLLPRLHAR